jgi:hypothetical protein
MPASYRTMEGGHAVEAAALRAVGSSSAIQQYVGIQMLSKVKDLQASQMGNLLSDFSAAQSKIPIPASLQVGANLDVSV